MKELLSRGVFSRCILQQTCGKTRRKLADNCRGTSIAQNGAAMRPISRAGRSGAGREPSAFGWITTVVENSARHDPLPTGHAVRERLFENLDGQLLNADSGCWRVRVYSIWGERGSWWLQLALEGEPEYTVTMRTAFGDDGTRALKSLTKWLAHPATSQGSPNVLLRRASDQSQGAY
jgi:hypothetical protein